MKNKWFDEVFLKSAIEKMENNKKHKNTMVLSEKQALVCHKYMNKDRYGISYALDGFYFLIKKRGSFEILSVERTRTNKQKNEEKTILAEIEKKEEELDLLYTDKEKNCNIIKAKEKEIDGLWEKYQQTYKVYA